MNPRTPSPFAVQFLNAKVAALTKAGDALKKLVPADGKGKRAVAIWELTKTGGKRDDKKTNL